ncbi:MAG TPA: alpha/beta hydrolase [Rhizomicrobium sp.]|jgi:pimeloyl-ACP methyl ester carboxylesterase|nr:alpha/beta hydrolase [Rhizomicrobium sp.]
MTSKPPVIMIHGGFCGPWVWDNFAARFRDAGYRVEVPALRHHHGDDPPPALATTSLADYAADLEKLIAGMKTPPILVGHSLGGLLAQMLAARCDIAAAILLAPSAPWGVPPSTLFEIGAAQGLMLRVGFWSMILEPVFDIAATHSLDRFPKEKRREVFEKFVPESGRVAFEILHWGLDMARTSEVNVAKVSCPLLFLTGDNDRISPTGTVQRAAALYKDRAQFITVPEMSHWLIGEPGWEQVCDRCLAWLESPICAPRGQAR